eukprot:gene12431-15181_t
MFVSSNNGVDSDECGYTITQSCKSIKSALNNFYINNVTDYQTLYPSLTLELDFGDYSGPNNNNISLYQYNITIKSPSQNNNNNNQIVNLIPEQSNNTIFSIKSNYYDTVDSWVNLNGLSMMNSNSKGVFLVVDHASNGTESIPNLYITIEGITISGSISPINSFIQITNSSASYNGGGNNTYVFITIRDSTFSGNLPYGIQNFAPFAFTSSSIMKNQFIQTNFEIDNTIFSQNQGYQILNIFGNVTVTNTKFLNNTSNYGCLGVYANIFIVQESTFIGNNASFWGGAISNERSYFNNYLSKIQQSSVVNSTFIDNYSGDYGGTLYVDTVRTMNITNSTFQLRKDASNKGPFLFCVSSNINSVGSTFQYINPNKKNSQISNSNMKSVVQCYSDSKYECQYEGQLADLGLCPT